MYEDTMTFTDHKIFTKDGWVVPEPPPVEPICRNCRFYVASLCKHPLNTAHQMTAEHDGKFDLYHAPADFGCIHFEAYD